MNKTNIIKASFKSSIPVEIRPINGVVVVPVSTQKDCRDLVVSYAYLIPNIHGDDTTIGSNKITVWTTHFIGETDMFDVRESYYKYDSLYVENGFLTTRRTDECERVGFVMEKPTSEKPRLTFFWDPGSKIELFGRYHSKSS